MKNSNWVTWEYYLLVLGVRSFDYAYSPQELYKHLDYFKKCWENELSQYKALEFLSFEIDKK